MDANKGKFVMIGLIVFVVTIIVFLVLLFSNKKDQKSFTWTTAGDRVIDLNN